MRLRIILGIAAAIIVAAISCKKADLIIGGDFAGGHFEIGPADTLVMPFTVTNMLGTGLDSTKLWCSSEEFEAGYAYTPGTGINGRICLIAPESLESADDVTLTLRVVSKDGRAAQADALVSIKD